jgi:hypothetical protein
LFIGLKIKVNVFLSIHSFDKIPNFQAIYEILQKLSTNQNDIKLINCRACMVSTVQSPYNRMKLANLTEFRDGSMSLSESFDPDDPALIDRFPDYHPETDIGNRPPTPTKLIATV